MGAGRTADPFPLEVSRHVWDARYRYRRGGEVLDRTLEDTWRRVARGLARAEPRDRAAWEERFLAALRGFRFLPGGRILAGAGTAHRVTLFNCFVMGIIEDSMQGIFEALEEGALTMQEGGGVGYDFSTLRPAGARARGTGNVASGPVSFMKVWDAMCATVLSTGARRGAMMATLRCDHPDVARFVAAKAEPGALVHFNLSVLVTDDLLEAVRSDREWPLVFPAERLDGGGDGPVVERRWPGLDGPVPCRVLRVVRARELWHDLLRATYERAEPGVLFIDRINRLDNLGYRERIFATNPCGEVPLPPYGACNLGSLDLTRFVLEPFEPGARLDLDALRAATAVAVRMLDDVIDVSRFPLPEQERQAKGARRIGLGITGLADALILLGLRYDSEPAREAAAGWMRAICHQAYRASVELAREKGSFPFFERERFLEGGFVAGLPDDVRQGVAEHGIRNSHLTAIAPTGTISLLAGNVSSGLEPVFDYCYSRRLRDRVGVQREHEVSDPAWRVWRERAGPGAPLPPQFVRAHEVGPEDQLAMQAALQRSVDQAISKTVQVSADFDFERFARLYQLADELGLKGCTTFRPNAVTGAVLLGAETGGAGCHCGSLEREPD
jgi:ribonucleoside-diphosphate reductase alpha chain